MIFRMFVIVYLLIICKRKKRRKKEDIRALDCLIQWTLITMTAFVPKDSAVKKNLPL